MELSSAIEAILFAAGESVPIARLSLVLAAEEEEILHAEGAEYRLTGPAWHAAD